MEKSKTHSARRVEKIRIVDHRLSKPITWSSLGHLIFIILFIALPKFTHERSVPAHIINVQLVPSSVPMPASAPEVEKKETVQAVEPVPAREQVVSTASKPKEAVSLAPEVIEKKRSMKKQTYKRERLLESAIKSVEKRADASKADQKQQALDKIRSALREKEAREAAVGSETAEGTATVSSGGIPTADIQMIYNAEVHFRIQRNWAFSDQVAGGEKNLYNMVAVVIRRSGDIEDIKFERKSGNSYFDNSTYKAILKSSPLPPIPDEIRGSSITLRFRFIPEGLK